MAQRRHWLEQGTETHATLLPAGAALLEETIEKAIAEMPQEMARYKNIAEVRERLIALLVEPPTRRPGSRIRAERQDRVRQHTGFF